VVETFPVFGQSSAAAEPSEGAFDDPALGQCDEACGLIRSLDDLDIDARQTDKAYATTLIDFSGGASNVADALLGPQDEIFGTANQFGNVGTATSTFDFRFQGDLLLGVIDSLDFSIVVNGAQIFTGSSVNDDVIDLGSNFGPNIDLTINGFGTFVIGGVVEGVPEPSTWALMLLGFAGLGFAGYRQNARNTIRHGSLPV
jgi:hypothetical protein